MTDQKYTILLGGVGGDAHSVGLTILRQALMRKYRVLYIGPQSDLEDFFHFASISNVVMISCMDGHARKYLRYFPELMRKYPSPKTKWYLGGNPVLGDEVGAERFFVKMGFDRAFCRFVDVRVLLDHLVRDLDGLTPAMDALGLWKTNSKLHSTAPIPDDHRLEEDELLQRRQEVLESWSTGADARHLENNAEFLSRQASFPGVQAKQTHRPLLQPRSGVALVTPQIDLLNAFKGGGADTLSYQVDSLTRNNNYTAAEEGIKESMLNGSSSINGFPVVNHGVKALRRVAEAVKMPMQTRHSTRSPELLAEISYAGGVTAYEGGSICYNVPYYKDYAPAEAIHAWQYVDRLTGLYADRYDVMLDREFFGTLTATLIPPSLAIVTGILESCLAASQGVKCVSIGYAEQGHRVQDVAAIRTIRSLAPEILSRMGFSGIQVNAVFHQYMAAFPLDEKKAMELIRQSATTSGLAGATRMLIKTAVEAYRIPSMADNLQALQLSRQGLDEAAEMQVDPDALAREEKIIREEIEMILAGVITCGKGSLTAGIVNAFATGVLDIPFAPSIYNYGEVMTARDLTGAVRFLDPGQLTLDSEMKSFHRDLMTDRCHAEGLMIGEDNHLLVEQDVQRISRGEYHQWPLGGTN